MHTQLILSNNVSTMLRRQSTSSLLQEHSTAEIAAKIDFFATLEVALSSGMKSNVGVTGSL